jgi:hypothetical protein
MASITLTRMDSTDNLIFDSFFAIEAVPKLQFLEQLP